MNNSFEKNCIVLHESCTTALDRSDFAPRIDLSFLDPPFNQDKVYNAWDDNLPAEEYWDQYPQIGDNTLNFAVPCHGDTEQNQQHDKMKIAFQEMECGELFSQMEIFVLQHHFNGKFLIFQMSLLVDD